MAKLKPDAAFAREGVELREWLRGLVSEDQSVRGEAGRRLRAMQLAMPSVDVDLDDLDYAGFDIKSHMDAFRAAVHDALHIAGFDLPDFIRRLFAIEISDAEQQQATWATVRAADQKRDDRYDRFASKLVDTINQAGESTEAERAVTRFAQLTAAYICSYAKEVKQSFSQLKNQTYEPDMRSVAGDALGSSVMLAPEALQALLAKRGTQWQANRLLENAGPAAAAFVPFFIDALDAFAANRDAARAFSPSTLAAIGRGSETLVQALIDRLGHRDAGVSNAASNVLELLGTDVAGHERQINDRLWPMLENEKTQYAAMSALASVGRADSRVRQFVIEQARPKPPRIKSPPDYPNYTYDEAMGERAEAIHLMRYFADFPAECVPVLIDAIESFEEYDPDWTYGGPVGRVATTLRYFDERAGPEAARALAAKLGPIPHDGDYPKSIVSALGAMGSAARDVLPQLESIWIRSAEGRTLAELEAENPDDQSDPAAWAILQIRRAST